MAARYASAWVALLAETYSRPYGHEDKHVSHASLKQMTTEANDLETLIFIRRSQMAFVQFLVMIALGQLPICEAI